MLDDNGKCQRTVNGSVMDDTMKITIFVNLILLRDDLNDDQADDLVEDQVDDLVDDPADDLVDDEVDNELPLQLLSLLFNHDIMQQILSLVSRMKLSEATSLAQIRLPILQQILRLV